MPRDQALVPESASETRGERPPFPPALMARVGFLLTMVRGGTLAICTEALSPLGLHVKQFGMLLVLASEGAHSQQFLSEWTRMDRTTMVALVDSLEERGYVRRERNPEDRRAYLVTITPGGRRALRRAETVMAKAESRVLASLSQGETKQLLELLAKVAADIGRPPPETAEPV
jgi:MarR family transcriptional regulator, lower aerobic nicotinate degradation pathway regulator